MAFLKAFCFLEALDVLALCREKWGSRDSAVLQMNALRQRRHPPVWE